MRVWKFLVCLREEREWRPVQDSKAWSVSHNYHLSRLEKLQRLPARPPIEKRDKRTEKSQLWRLICLGSSSLFHIRVTNNFCSSVMGYYAIFLYNFSILFRALFLIPFLGSLLYPCLLAHETKEKMKELNLGWLAVIFLWWMLNWDKWYYKA